MAASRAIATAIAGVIALAPASKTLLAQATVDSENRYSNVGAIMVWRVDDTGNVVARPAPELADERGARGGVAGYGMAVVHGRLRCAARDQRRGGEREEGPGESRNHDRHDDTR